MKSLFIKNVPSELGRRLKVASIEGGVSMRDMVLVAVEEYLDRMGGIIEVKKPIVDSDALSSDSFIKAREMMKIGELVPNTILMSEEFKPKNMPLPYPSVIKLIQERDTGNMLPGGIVDSLPTDPVIEVSAPEDETKAHDDTAPLKVYAILKGPDGVDIEVPIDNFTRMGNTRKGFKRTW